MWGQAPLHRRQHEREAEEKLHRGPREQDSLNGFRSYPNSIVNSPPQHTPPYFEPHLLEPPQLSTPQLFQTNKLRPPSAAYYTDNQLAKLAIDEPAPASNEALGEAGLGTASQSTLLRVVEIDPYQHIDHLGSGAYGYVDTVRKVDQPSTIFARKTIRITAGRNREVQLKSVQREFEILARLKHIHVISVKELYSFKNRLSIIILNVADTDMKEYLEN